MELVSEVSEIELDSLDTVASVNSDGTLSTTIYYKPTDYIMGATVIDRRDLDLFLHALGTFHPAMELVSEVSEIELDSLDTVASVNSDGTSSGHILILRMSSKHRMREFLKSQENSPLFPNRKRTTTRLSW